MKVPDLLPVARSGYSHLSPRTPFRRSGQLATIQPALPWFHNLANHMAGRVLLFGKKQSPLSGDSFEWLLTIIDEPQVRSFNQVLDGMGDQYLVSLGHRSDAGRDHGYARCERFDNRERKILVTVGNSNSTTKGNLTAVTRKGPTVTNLKLSPPTNSLRTG